MKNSVKILCVSALTLLSCAGDPGLTPQQQSARHSNSLGVVAMDQHNYVEGRKQFDTARSLDPDYPTAHANLGIALYSLGQYDSAAVSLETALSLAPEHRHAAYTMGLILQAQGRDTERALQLLRGVAANDPDDPHVRYYMGRAQAKLGHVDSAMATFRRVIELDESNVSAWYAMAQLYRQTGDSDAFRETLQTFNQLSQAGGEGVSSAYQGQGKYAEAVADTPFGRESDRSALATFEAAAGIDGLTARTAYLTVVDADADADGRDDLLLEQAGKPVLLRDVGPAYRADSAWSFESTPGAGQLLIADLDDDGDADAIAAGIDARILLQENGQFVAHGDLGPCSRAVAGDADHDGDSDIACGDGPMRLLSNDGTGQLNDITARAEVHAAGVTEIIFSDIDADRDVDILTAGSGGLALWSNARDGTFQNVAAERNLNVEGARTIAVGDFVADGRMDIVAISSHQSVLLHNQGRLFEPQTLSLPGSARQIIAADLDNDGDLDLLARDDESILVSMATAQGFGEAETVHRASSRHLAVVDADQDGRLDVITTTATLFNRSSAGNALRIDLAGLNSNPDGLGARVEVTTSTDRQLRELRSTTSTGAHLHVGLGNAEAADFVRVLWPSGVRQTERDTLATGRLSITEVNRKGTSCPILYAWDGERFAFVSDFLGGGIVGYLVGPDAYYTPDSDEYLPLPALQPTDAGRYTLQVGNQLEEVIYLDAAELVAVDHPAGTQMRPGERLLSAPPYPAFAAHVLAETRPVRRVVDRQGQDVTKQLRHVDDVWYDGFERLEVHGYARRHELTLDLGDLTAGDQPVLLAHGWVDYAHSTSHWAAVERGWTLTPPRLEARSDGGPWRLVTEDMGVPAGLPKQMLVDLREVFDGPVRDAQLRVSTNTPVYWDQFEIGLLDAGASPAIHRVALSGDLHWRGYPAHESIHGTFAYRYDYENVAPDMGWGTHGGAYTRYGDVTELLTGVDDRFVVMFHGDELTLDVDAAAFPKLADGWERSFLFYANGFGKDMDFHSAHSQTVEPLPFHGMSRYPYGDDEAYPTTPEHVDYVLNWNTRWIKGYYR